ncbi:Uncharacterised protein [Mycobacteroides abscessus subsp. abscessus]|nr:Uncharacterised protein [Mycobacteroides abscessus subsp. abscessus]
MGSQRSLLRSLSAGKAGKRHTCRANANHVLVKGDPILIVKVDRDNFHYCLACADKFIATARTNLIALETELHQAGQTATEPL